MAQLRDEGILDGASVSAPAPEVTIEVAVAVPSTVAPSSHDVAEAVVELKRKNARLREQLEKKIANVG